MRDVVRSKGRSSSTGRLQTTTGGDDRHHIRAEPCPASEETAHDDTVRLGCTHSPGELAIPPRPRGRQCQAGVAATPCAMPLTAREAWGAGHSSTDRKKDDGAAGEQNSEIKQRDLVSFNPEEEPRSDAESRVTVALHTLRKRPVQWDRIC